MGSEKQLISVLHRLHLESGSLPCPCVSPSPTMNKVSPSPLSPSKVARPYPAWHLWSRDVKSCCCEQPVTAGRIPKGSGGAGTRSLLPHGLPLPAAPVPRGTVPVEALPKTLCRGQAHTSAHTTSVPRAGPQQLSPTHRTPGCQLSCLDKLPGLSFLALLSAHR